MKEGTVTAAGAVTSHNLINKIPPRLQGLLSKNSPGLTPVGSQCPHFLSSVSLSFQTGERDLVVPTTKPTGCRAACAAEPPAEGWPVLGSGQQFPAVGQPLTAGSTQQWPLLGLHNGPAFASNCQQLQDNGMVLVHLAEGGFLWVT